MKSLRKRKLLFIEQLLSARHCLLIFLFHLPNSHQTGLTVPISQKNAAEAETLHICLESHSSEAAGPSRWVPAVDLRAWASPEISANIHSFLHLGLALSRTKGGQCWLSTWGLKVCVRPCPGFPRQWTLSPASCCLSPRSQKPAASSRRGWGTDRGTAQPCLLRGIRGPQLVASQPCWVRQTEKETGGILNEPLLVLAEGELGTASIYASVQWVSWQIEFVIC